MPSKILTVVGATGTQGLSLINTALLEGDYHVRGVTRNPSSEKAQALAKRGVEVVKGDIDDEASLVAAFQGSSAIYAVTNFFEPFSQYGADKAIEIETTQGINLAKAASKTSTLEHYIWSTLPNSGRVTNGKWEVPHCTAKNKVDDYIKSDAKLLAKTTFFWITFYGNNFQYPMFTPNAFKTSGAYVQLSPVAADVPVTGIGSPVANIGKFAYAILKQPQKTLPGRFVLASTEQGTLGSLLQDWSEVTGKPAHFVQTSLETYSKVWPVWGIEMGVMLKMWEELREKSWSGEPDILTRDDLGLKDAEFVDFKGALKEMDWSALV